MAKTTQKKPINSPKTKRKSSAKPTQKELLRQELREVAGIDSKRDYIPFVVGMLLLIVAVFMLLSIISNIFTGGEDQAKVLAGQITQAANYGGKLGAITSYYLMNKLFGVFSIFIPIFLLAAVIRLMLREASPVRLWLVFVHFMVIMVLGSVDAHYIQEEFLPEAWKQSLSFELGGFHGKEVYNFLKLNIGAVVTGVILVLLTLGYVGYWFTQVFIWLFLGLKKTSEMLFGTVSAEYEEEADETAVADTATAEADSDAAASEGLSEDGSEETLEAEEETTAADDETLPSDADVEEEDLDSTPSDEDEEDDPSATTEGEAVDNGEVPITITAGQDEERADGKTLVDDNELPPYDPKLDLSRYKYPPLSLLEKHDQGNITIDAEEQNANKEQIIRTLADFKVRISEITATVGPTVTLYEIKPEAGMRISKIKNLEDDIALSLAALGIRIIAPIPGKGTIGIEVPNRQPQIVSMESILNTKKFQETKFDLPIALGKTITNEVYMVDLAKMPHLLVAGATGQGKSVGLNAIITSLLYKKHPAELKLVMIDPKKVEFSMYQPLLKHFLAQVPDSEEPVITDVTKVVQTLKSLCQEMDDRYDLLKKAMVRNLKEYNAKFISRRLNPNDGHKFLPYIVVVIDEYGDLMMTAGKDIELPIARIAQLARAVGIHMIIATQSPRAEIITGKIKANFPARMAFRVMGPRESGIILDGGGANSLIGRGDMLMLHQGNVTRVQCAFVDTPEVEAITAHIAAQQGYPYPFELPLVADEAGEGSEPTAMSGGSTFEQVARYVVSTQQGSTSKIQRTFSIGFNRAGRLMDQLEEAGIVGPVNGSKPREVYVQSETELQNILDLLKEQGKHFE